MSTKPETKAKDGKLDRRNLFKALGGVSAAAAVGSTAVTTPAQATENSSERTKARYKESPHVKAFYATNRY